MFAQESVMDIKKVNHLLEQFEKTKTFKRFFSTLLRFDEDLDCFVATEKWRDKEAELLTAAWWMFAEVATAQPVPEGFEQAYSEIFSPIIKQPYPRLENGDYKYIEIDQGWKLWQTAAAQAVPEGFVLVPKENISCYWQDNDEPENFCSNESDFDCLGDCIDLGEIMEINKFTQAHVNKEILFGTWFAEAIDPSEKANFFVGTHAECLEIVAKNKAMIEAQEQSHE